MPQEQAASKAGEVFSRSLSCSCRGLGAEVTFQQGRNRLLQILTGKSVREALEASLFPTRSPTPVQEGRGFTTYIHPKRQIKTRDANN